ncbi:MAG: HU family DNA-binding protein [Bacteroides sp.]|nr:HU family DNA-binding protein [Bacteroides sp.]
MRKNELARELAVSEKLHLSTAMKAIDGFVCIVKEALSQGEEITIRGFGTLSVIQLKERTARNPRTGEEVTVRAHRTVKFKPSKEFKTILNEDGTLV